MTNKLGSRYPVGPQYRAHVLHGVYEATSETHGVKLPRVERGYKRGEVDVSNDLMKGPGDVVWYQQDTGNLRNLGTLTFI